MTGPMGERGSATLLAIFLSAIIITLGIGFNWLVKEHLKAAEGLKLKTDAMLDAYSAFDSAVFFLVTAAKSPSSYTNGNETLLGTTELPANGEFKELRKDLKVRISDSNGLVSLSTPDREALEKLIAAVAGIDASEIVDSYLDWVDSDDLVRLKGAEEPYYSAMGLPYKPRNYGLQYKEELALVKGMDQAIFRKIAPLLTMLPATGFNPNTAPKAMLKAAFGIDDELAANLSLQFLKKPALSNLDLMAYAGKYPRWGSNDLSFELSPFLEITITSGYPEPFYRLHAGVGLTPTEESSFTLLFWKEG
jgi:general secretion pathway protein K